MMQLKNRRRFALMMTALLAVLLLAGCGRRAPEPTATPAPTATPIPTATPTPTATPEPTSGDESTEPTAAIPATTPAVTIPEGFEPTSDAALGYSLALPDGWTTLDLRGPNFQRLAGAVGLSEQLAPLNDFLDSPEGDAIGLVAASDLSGMLFGGLPTILNVTVVEAEGTSPETVKDLVQQTLQSNSTALGDLTVESLEAATVNNLPAVRANAVIDLGSVGMDAQFFVTMTGLIANDKVYILTLATEADNRGAKEAEFDQIIGTFRPE